MNYLNLNISKCNSERLAVLKMADIDMLNWNHLPAMVEINFLDFAGKEDVLLRELSESEKLRSFNYKKKNDALRFIVGRAFLRKILGKLLGIEASSLVIELGENKKPVITYPFAKINFNVSHAKSKVLIAIDRHAIGVDIESAENAFKAPLIGQKVLSVSEQFSILKSENQRQAFCLLWTRKEAFLKALGKGIDDDMVDIPSIEGRYKIWGLNDKEVSEWSIASFNSETEYVYSLAFKTNSFNQSKLTLCKVKEDFIFN